MPENEPEILKTFPGDYLPDVIARALARATESGAPVRFTFNDATVDVLPGQSADVTQQAIQAQWDAQAVAYRASPEGQKARAEAAVRLVALQAKHDRLMATLPATFASDRAAIEWLEEYSDPADDTRVAGRDFACVVRVLEASGYKVADALGLDQTAYQKPRILARYLVGQALDQMRGGMPPHPGMMARFAADYRRITAIAKAAGT